MSNKCGDVIFRRNNERYVGHYFALRCFSQTKTYLNCSSIGQTCRMEEIMQIFDNIPNVRILQKLK